MSLPSRERGLKLYCVLYYPYNYTSLPSRERGLKLWLFRAHRDLFVSLPSRERGLKSFKLRFQSVREISSLPSRERGLKSADYRLCGTYRAVAPFAGAWIEISPLSKM